MDFYTLCEQINLQPMVREQVNSFVSTYDLHAIQPFFTKFQDIETMNTARIELQDILGEDKQHIKILSCMLYLTIETYTLYQNYGISDNIYIDTMSCFTRFIKECYEKTGNYTFDREWWTARQVGFHLFRLGDLEYEMVYQDGNPMISIHIPSDAVFTTESVDESLCIAKSFFRRFFPQFQDSTYICESWLLEPTLQDMLTSTSNIVRFQSRFRIIEQGEPNNEFIEWLYHTNITDYNSLPEQTSLQRKMKKYLLSGGTVCNPLGILMH